MAGSEKKKSDEQQQARDEYQQFVSLPHGRRVA
jgi:hypothetical protein